VTAVSPAVSEAVGAGDLERVRTLYRHSSWASYILAATGYLLLVLFSREVLGLYDPRYADYGLILAVVGWGFLFDTFAGCGGYLLIARGKSHYLMYNSLVTILLNIGLNFVLISRFGLVGAAAATAISYLVKNGFIVVENYLLDRTHPFSLLHVVSLLMTAIGAAWIWQGEATRSIVLQLVIGVAVAVVGLGMLALTFRDLIARRSFRF
jgi:O-antigen/teichoic acid export membrane protein